MVDTALIQRLIDAPDQSGIIDFFTGIPANSHLQICFIVSEMRTARRAVIDGNETEIKQVRDVLSIFIP